MKMMSVSKLPSLVPLFFILLFSFFKLSSSIENRCPEIEKQSLLNFKQALQDPNNSLSTWNNEESDCCGWKGVRCSNSTGHVHQLRLQNSVLSGRISPSLLNLKHLKYLDLSRNHFNETIPFFIGSLTTLEYLNLSFVEFHGKIPQNIGNLSNLHSLSLEHDIFLEVDSLAWLSRLSKLERLNMNSVNLRRASNWAQQVINKLPSLVELYLSGCSLNFTTPLTSSGVNNITTSNLAILDLSVNYNFMIPSGIIVPVWLFQLGNLIYLDLSGNYYDGSIPTVSNTTKLKYLDLSFNRFNSSIPEWLYFIKDLEYLKMQRNNLQDAISNSIANLTSLITLDLSENNLSGKLPRGITNLCKLQFLHLGWNKLQGGVSDLLGNVSSCFLGSLEYLNLESNQLSGHLTHQFGEFKFLRILRLGNNSLSGIIPSNLGNLPSLHELDFEGNKLTGNLPESMGQLSKLQFIFIDNNMLEGVVTETHFAHLSRLEQLFASGNNLTLKVHPNWIPPFKIQSLRLGSWNLGSRIPPWLDTQKVDIWDLDLSNTGIYGNVPNWLWGVIFLNLSHNHLQGKIPIISKNGDDYHRPDQFVYLGSNMFNGPLPRIGKTLCDLDLSNNSFSGNITDFLCNTTTYGLQNLHLGGNHLAGELPDCFMKWSSLGVLNLENNNFSGRIPNSIGLLANLESLNLDGNNLSGDIPLAMHNCTELLKIDMSDNILSGNLPEQIVTSLSKLVILILKSNRLSGEITSTICQLSSLQILDLSHNRFSGMIPRCVDNFTAMTTKRNSDRFRHSRYSDAFLDSASMSTKGMELTYDTILLLVTGIDLSKNNLSGDIPREITTLVELRSLNLSGNRLTGMIPRGIGNMKQLESLDFSINSLSGELPNSFRDMSSLNYLNVSYNNLTGRIPESTQLRGLNESSFIGNNLCGPPLTSSCNIDDGKAPGTMHPNDEEGDKAEIEWFYVFLSLGYAVGLSAVLITLYLKRSLKEAYHEFLENLFNEAYVYIHIKWRRITRVLGPNM